MWINKDLIDDNQQLDTLVPLRRCKDGLQHTGEALKIGITKKVFTSVRGARSRYENDLKDKKKKYKKMSLKRKKEEISQLSAKVKQLTDEPEYLIRMEDERSVKAERKKSWSRMLSGTISLKS